MVRPKRGQTQTLRMTALVAMTLLSAVSAARAQNAPSGEEGAREITMTAKKYEFSPSEIKAHQGEKIKLVITALDRKHGFELDAFGINHELPKGEAVTIEFTADRAGRFPFKCSKFCGFGHKKMKGELIVE